MAQRFHLPNFIGYCPFELRIHSQCRANALASEKWLRQFASPAPALSASTWKIGLLASMCFPTVDSAQLRVCTDILGLMAVIRNMAEDPGCSPDRIEKTRECVLSTFTSAPTSGASALAAGFKDVWRRLSKTCPTRLQARLIQAFDDWFNALAQFAHDRLTGAIPDTESYLEWRRTESGCEIGFLLLEYAHDLSTPHDPLLLQLRAMILDLIVFSDDVYSYKLSLARHSQHNLVSLLMLYRGFRLQDAINEIGSIYQATLKSFIHTSQSLPSTTFLRGLEAWAVGSLHWPFEAERYFGSDGMQVRERRLVELA